MTREDIAPISMEATQTIISLEVAEMIGMEHSKLLRKVDGINKDFTEAKIGLSEYWLESQYFDKSGKSNRCYNITKKGCEFLAHKTTGTKGNIFTARYMERFEQMENSLKNIQQFQMSDEEILSRALLISDAKVKQLEGEVEDLRPRAEFAEYISCSTDTVDVDTMAKILKQNGFNKLGTNGFFKWLRENKYLKITNGENVPTQKSINLKIMKIKETATEDKDGNIRIHRQARITPKGQEYFIKKFKEAKDVRNDK